MPRVVIDLLGPFRLYHRGQPVLVGAELQRALLAVLAVSAPRRVSVGTLADALWSGRGPRPGNERATLQTYVARLRRVLPDAIATQGDGYQLAVPAEAVDAYRFTRLCDRATAARGTTAERDAVGAALALWRGQPFDELRCEWLDVHHAPQLEERHLELVERRAALRLADGDVAGLTAELAEVAGRHPSHEPIWARWIEALELTERVPEALQRYETIRVHVAETFGADLGPELREIHARLLGRTPSRRRHREPPNVPPRQLPADVPQLVGRADAQRALDDVLAGSAGGAAPVVVAITGMAGVGKTALAVHWATRVADRFPDGQLYVNLRGFEPSAAPADPAEVIRGFLAGLHVAPERMPDGLDAQAGLYRSVTSRKRLLVVLDNARDAAQVTPLLPGAGGCLVVVTSRDQLPGLVAAGSHPVVLEPLSSGDARRLLAARIGDTRVADEIEATDDIAARCAGLPLALSLVAARAATHRDFRLDALAADLRDVDDRLDALSGADTASDVRAVFSWSYRTLGRRAARVFRLLGLHPGQDVQVAAVASLAGLPVRDARALLAELHRAHLVAEPVPGRYALHDLLRAYATELVRDHEPPADRADAERRLFDHYVRTGASASGRLTSVPGDERASVTGVSPEPVPDYAAAMGWYRAELPALLALLDRAVDRGRYHLVGRLAPVLADYLDRCGQWHTWAGVERAALDAARRSGDLDAEARALHMLARAHAKLGRHEEAYDQCETAIEYYRRLGDVPGEATAHRTLTYPAGRLGRYPAALEHGRLALELYRRIDHEYGVASSLNAVGWAYAQLGAYREALAYCSEALQRLERTEERRQQAATWDSLGFVHVRLDEVDEAVRCYLRSADLYRELGDSYGEAMALNRLGDVYRAVDRHHAAADVWHRALTLLDPLDHPDAEGVRDALDRLTSGTSAAGG